jgi:SagB-type dehydrogenase family enzyme
MSMLPRDREVGAEMIDGPRRARHGVQAVACAALGLIALALPSCGGEERRIASPSPPPAAQGGGASGGVALPAPRREGRLSVEEALAQRRSVREYADAALTAAQLSQLLWAAQGVSEPSAGLRTAPSAGALYPLELYAAVERVSGLAPGVYRYVPRGHRLEPVSDGSVRARLSADALSQQAIAEAPVTLALAAVFARTTQKYGERGRRYVLMEAGHAAQNVYLQATALGLGTVVIGAFDDGRVRSTLGMRSGEEPLYLMPVGAPAAG